MIHPATPPANRLPSRRISAFIWLFAFVIWASLLLPASAQWATETYYLQPGWNAIWLPIDCSDRTIDTVLAVPTTVSGDPSFGPLVLEIWQWNPPSSGGFTTSPSTPSTTDVQWRQWAQGAGGSLGALTGNAAYLIHLDDGLPPPNEVGFPMGFPVSVTGKPLLPSLPWSNSGVNLVGFQTASSNPIDFYDFFKICPALAGNPNTFQYVGGPLTSNPVQVTAPSNTPVSRNQAYWVQSTTYTSYYGPIAITISGASQLSYGTTTVNLSVQIKNVTDPAQNQSLTATLSPSSSAGAPDGPDIAGDVPLMVQSAVNPTTGGYTYTPLTSYTTPSLAPGQYTTVVLAVNRAAMTAAAGSVYQSLLNVTDSLGYTSINLGVNATTSSYAGVWSGTATITNVDEVLSNGTVDAGGNGTVTVTTNPTTGVVSPFALRFLLHQASGGGSNLLQQVFVANDATNAQYACLTEAGLSAITNRSGPAGRLSTAFFPPGGQGQPGVYSGSGAVGLSGSSTYSINLGAGDSTNPFLHEYHPDHQAPNSYPVTRTVTLTFQPTLTGVSDTDPSWGSTTLGGTYQETISGLRAAAQNAGVNVTGTFVIHRVNTAAALQQ